MAFMANQRQQLCLEDSTYSLTERSKKMLKKSWAENFAQHIFPQINEDRFSVLYSTHQASRPNTPVNVIIGLLLLKEMFGSTDEELMETVLFDVRYQYALHTTSFAEQPVSDRTLSRFRERLYVYEQETGIDLMKAEMESLAKAFVKLLQINPQMKRMDSLMIASSCKQMSRLEIFYRCVSNMVKAVQATGETVLLDSRLLAYLDPEKENNTLYRIDSSQTQSKLEEVCADAVRLWEICADGYQDVKEYRLLERVVGEQTEETDHTRSLRSKKEIRTDSLQNPSDEEATFREKAGKKHRGYVGNVVETFDDKGAIITGMSYKPNIHSDIAFCKEVIAEESWQEEPVILIADGAYGSDQTQELAKEKNIQLITTALIGKSPDAVVADYVIDEEQHTLLRCPAGRSPQSCQYKVTQASYYAHFDKSYCMHCPHRKHCGATFQKKTVLVRISTKTIRRAEHVRKMSESQYRQIARKRNAVEGMPSVLRRRYQVDHMPVRGYIRTKCMYFLKVGAINVMRVLKAVSSNPLSALHGRLGSRKISTPALFQVRIHREEFACA